MENYFYCGYFNIWIFVVFNVLFFTFWFLELKIGQLLKNWHNVIHMTKGQKMGFWAVLGLFIIPELLWSPVGNFIYELDKNTGTPFRNTFLEDSSNINILSTVLFIQLLGLFCSAVYLIIIHNSVKNKWLLWPSVVILLLSSVVVFYLFGFSINLRSIGF